VTATRQRAEAIKDAFHGCTSVAEVNVCARDHAAEVTALERDPLSRPYAIHIKNLAAYMRQGFIHHRVDPPSQGG